MPPPPLQYVASSTNESFLKLSQFCHDMALHGSEFNWTCMGSFENDTRTSKNGKIERVVDREFEFFVRTDASRFAVKLVGFILSENTGFIAAAWGLPGLEKHDCHAHDHAMMMAWRPYFLAWSSWFEPWSWYDHQVFHVFFLKKNWLFVNVFWISCCHIL